VGVGCDCVWVHIVVCACVGGCMCVGGVRSHSHSLHPRLHACPERREWVLLCKPSPCRPLCTQTMFSLVDRTVQLRRCCSFALYFGQFFLWKMQRTCFLWATMFESCRSEGPSTVCYLLCAPEGQHFTVSPVYLCIPPLGPCPFRCCLRD
jgi:hypothetical protein